MSDQENAFELMSDAHGDTLLTEQRVAQIFCVTVRSLDNWDRDKKMKDLGWELPLMVNGRRRRKLSVIRRVINSLPTKIPTKKGGA
jgi:hypothetical protein